MSFRTITNSILDWMGLPNGRKVYKLGDLMENETSTIDVHKLCNRGHQRMMDIYHQYGRDSRKFYSEGFHKNIKVSAITDERKSCTDVLSLWQVDIKHHQADGEPYLKFTTLTGTKPGDEYAVEIKLENKLPNGLYEVSGLLEHRIYHVIMGIGVSSTHSSVETVFNSYDWDKEKGMRSSEPYPFKFQFRVEDVYDGENWHNDSLKLVIKFYHLGDAIVPKSLAPDDFHGEYYIDRLRFTRL